jgi:hypothetical protein
MGGLKGAITVAQQHAHRGRANVGHGEVKMAVAVKVSHGHGIGSGAGGVADGSLEGAVPIAQQDTHGVRKVVGDGEVEMAVAPEVPHRHGHGSAPDVIADLGKEAGDQAILQDLNKRTIRDQSGRMCHRLARQDVFGSCCLGGTGSQAVKQGIENHHCRSPGTRRSAIKGKHYPPRPANQSPGRLPDGESPAERHRLIRRISLSHLFKQKVIVGSFSCYCFASG